MYGCDIKVVVEQERLSRRKHGMSLWYENPLQRAIDYCLAAEGISMADVKSVTSSDTLPARVRFSFRNRALQQFPHHLCHAASAHMMLPKGAKSGVLVYDGFGSVRGRITGEPLQNLRETFSFFHFDERGYKCLGHTTGRAYVEKDEFPIGVSNSIGMLYEMVTALLGYDVMDSGKTMGLSSHGTPRYLGVFEKFVTFHEDPSNCFSCSTDDPALQAEIERIITDGKGGFPVRADLAASVQALVNKTLLHCEQFFSKRDIDYLCISGGCGLNTVANSFLVEHSTLDVPIHIPPHCGDAGMALGALWLKRFAECGHAPELTFRGGELSPRISRPGRHYSREECRAAAQQFYPRLANDSSVVSARDVARILARGEIVGVLNGGSEIGPRALGGRSILADPLSAMMRERINRVIKGREPFRPLAPMVLQSQYDDYFYDTRNADPFMLKVSRVRERCLREAPAVVHVDGTARVQVVPDGGDPFLTDLLSSFREETGRGVLLNTSFNRRGEPIVESPVDAVDAFLGMGLDALYLDGEFYRRAE
jgi:carbamoyltransferase